MQWRNQNPANDGLPSPPEALRQAIYFWILWSLYVCLSGFLITALLTDWPAFLHETPSHFEKVRIK